MYENIKNSVMRGIYSDSKSYRDYRYLQDDKTVLKNPHKGFYWHFIDNGIGSIKYRDGVEDDTSLSFPGLNHLYLRFDWADIEKTEGCYDWDYIDSVTDRWGKLGYKFSVRICCYEGGSIKYATPEWVRLSGAKGYFCGGGCWQPDYGDEIFLLKLENFLSECSRKFDRNPLIEYLDVGTYGTWGEGHTGFGSGNSFPTDVLLKHIELHLKYFPNKYVTVNDDMINASANEGGTRRRELLDFCAEKRMGFRDDSILCSCYTSTNLFGYDTLRTPFMFDMFYENAPVDIESEHYTHIDEDTFKNGLPLIEALKRTHATFCGFHDYPRNWIKDNLYLAEYLANRLGYWYFLDFADIPECVSGSICKAIFGFSNRGYCHSYYPYTLKIMLKNDFGVYEIGSFEGINKSIKSQSSQSFELDLDFTNVPNGDYGLLIGMFEEDTPIKLGIREECKADEGYYLIDELTVRGKKCKTD